MLYLNLSNLKMLKKSNFLTCRDMFDFYRQALLSAYIKETSEHWKLQLRLSLTGCTVTMVTCYAMTITMIGLTMTGHLFNVMYLFNVNGLL